MFLEFVIQISIGVVVGNTKAFNTRQVVLAPQVACNRNQTVFSTAERVPSKGVFDLFLLDDKVIALASDCDCDCHSVTHEVIHSDTWQTNFALTPSGETSGVADYLYFSTGKLYCYKWENYTDCIATITNNFILRSIVITTNIQKALKTTEARPRHIPSTDISWFATMFCTAHHALAALGWKSIDANNE